MKALVNCQKLIARYLGGVRLLITTLVHFQIGTHIAFFTFLSNREQRITLNSDMNNWVFLVD